jgi:hypothetical protein
MFRLSSIVPTLVGFLFASNLDGVTPLATNLNEHLVLFFVKILASSSILS